MGNFYTKVVASPFAHHTLELNFPYEPTAPDIADITFEIDPHGVQLPAYQELLSTLSALSKQSDIHAIIFTARFRPDATAHGLGPHEGAHWPADLLACEGDLQLARTTAREMNQLAWDLYQLAIQKPIVNMVKDHAIPWLSFAATACVVLAKEPNAMTFPPLCRSPALHSWGEIPLLVKHLAFRHHFGPLDSGSATFLHPIRGVLSESIQLLVDGMEAFLSGEKLAVYGLAKPLSRDTLVPYLQTLRSAPKLHAEKMTQLYDASGTQGRLYLASTPVKFSVGDPRRGATQKIMALVLASLKHPFSPALLDLEAESIASLYAGLEN